MASSDDDGRLTEQRLERMRNEFLDAQHRRRQLSSSSSSSSSSSRNETDSVRPVDDGTDRVTGDGRARD